MNYNYSIWKYTLKAETSQMVEVPFGAEILSLKTQGDDIVIYALVDTQETYTTSIEVRVYGTGHYIDVNIADYRFLGTAKLHGGALMFHVFYSF
jgi:hypothetical protein